MKGEIIEDYPLSELDSSKESYPSCLILGIAVNGKTLHVVAGCKESKLIIITAYYPDLEHWNDDYKTRRN